MPANSGSFRPGQSGNPSGRPKKDPDAMAILKAAIPSAARRLVELSRSKNEKIALQAASAIFDRVWGKPMQTQEVHMDADMNLRAEVRAALLERAAKAGCTPEK
ncbi:MAG: hypothetical protein IJR68_04705 [Fretibacterium sp.]|nr:hypothetical protein [Fretibacterium sp.]